MSEPIATLEKSSPSSDYLDDYEVTTNRLASGTLEKPKPAYGVEDWDMVPDGEWLLRLTGGLSTAELDDEEPQAVAQTGSRFATPRAQARGGMSAHTSAVEIVPTRGARFTTGLKRGLLLVLLTALGVGMLAGGGYLLAETAWLSNLFSPVAPAPEPPAQPPEAAQPQPEPPPVAQQELRDSRLANPQPAREAAPSIPADIEEAALAGSDAIILRDQGIKAYRAGSYVEAVALLEQSIALNSDDPSAQYHLGMAYMAVTGRQHALDDAELAFRTAVSLQPGWAAAHQMLAETFLRRGFHDEAIPAAREATRLDPTMVEAWLTLGRAYTAQAWKQKPPWPTPKPPATPPRHNRRTDGVARNQIVVLIELRFQRRGSRGNRGKQSFMCWSRSNRYS